eukprot:CAMPEP_0172771056 /NCGR_PEP_ID=MMETSP1074-20121228/189902_1 /TAXON_ID=2916 /ORGANISM="Ceratium fusus, Strain PA161109" /LENGTH=73 /DNA_ID=CAMNT_0013606933 /DNA_START=281 /DNA_END=502 /DNA_ORIENTATION=+
MLPSKGPAPFKRMLVLNMGTLLPSSMWRGVSCADANASSQLKEQPRRNACMSPVLHRSVTSSRSSVITPSLQT